MGSDSCGDRWGIAGGHQDGGCPTALANNFGPPRYADLGQPEAFIHGTEDNFDEAGNLSEGVAKFMKRWIDAFLEFVEANQPK